MFQTNHLVETLARIRRLGVQDLFFKFQLISVLVNVNRFGVGQDRLGFRVKGGHTALQEFGGQSVVVGQPHEIFALRKFEPAPEVPVDAAVYFAAIVMDAGIAFDEAATNLFSAVGGGVVRDDDLKIRIGLRERRLQGVLQIVVPVIDRHRNAYPGFAYRSFSSTPVRPIVRAQLAETLFRRQRQLAAVERLRILVGSRALDPAQAAGWPETYPQSAMPCCSGSGTRRRCI